MNNTCDVTIQNIADNPCAVLKCMRSLTSELQRDLTINEILGKSFLISGAHGRFQGAAVMQGLDLGWWGGKK